MSIPGLLHQTKFWELPKSSSWSLGIFPPIADTIAYLWSCISKSLFTVDALEDCPSLVIDDAEVFEVFFTTAFASKVYSQTSQVPVTVWGSEVLPTVNGKEARDAVSKLDVPKCLEPDGMQPALLERTGQCHRKATHCCVWKLMMNREVLWCVEKGKHHSPPQEEQEGESK